MFFFCKSKHILKRNVWKSIILCKSVLTKEVVVNKIPSVEFDILSDVCLGDEIQIKYISDENEPKVVSWEYSFGDGSFSHKENPRHTYNYVSSFDVGLSVVSLVGCKNDTMIPAKIEIHDFPVADFKASNLFVSELNPEIHFFNLSLACSIRSVLT